VQEEWSLLCVIEPPSFVSGPLEASVDVPITGQLTPVPSESSADRVPDTPIGRKVDELGRFAAPALASIISSDSTLLGV